MQTLRLGLADPAARLITLIGPGGAGKTRLALELAHAIADEGATRVVFVHLAAIRDSAFVASAMAEALGLADVTARDLPRRARAACEDHPTLMVLDNFEHVLDAAPHVREWPHGDRDLSTALSSPWRKVGQKGGRVVVRNRGQHGRHASLRVPAGVR